MNLNNLSQYEAATLWIGAFRYALGRMTGVVGETCNMLIAYWPEIPERAKVVIRRDLEEEIAKDDEGRGREGTFCYPLGMDMDRASWMRVWEVIK